MINVNKHRLAESELQFNRAVIVDADHINLAILQVILPGLTRVWILKFNSGICLKVLHPVSVPGFGKIAPSFNAVV